jgi:hypothetical protein
MAALTGLAVGGAACGHDETWIPGTFDVTLPDPGPSGFQLATGEIAVARGEESQNCYFYQVPFDRPVFVNRIVLAQNIGSHHMNVFRVRTVKNLDGSDGQVVREGECWKPGNWSDWPLVANSQSAGVETWQLPEGVALRFEPGEKIMLQSHYVNATTQSTPSVGKVVVNFHTMEAAEVQAELGTLFATNQNIRVCPGQSDVRFEASCKLAQSGPVTVVAANGHFHSRGRRFTMMPWDSATGRTGEPFYESRTWDDPPFPRALSVPIRAGDGVSWACEFAAPSHQCGDQSDDCCFTFGGKVEAQEHCNAFIYYYPRGNTDINCF